MNLTNNFESHQNLLVLSRREVALDVIELEFSSLDGAKLPKWNAGAHIDLHLSNGMTRQYSLMEGLIDPSNWRIAVLIEREGKGGSLEIEKDLEVGSVVNSEGPRNHFPLVNSEEYLFVAGGIGITPLIRMIDEVEKLSTPWRLAYLGRDESTMAYSADLLNTYGPRVELFISSQGNRFDVNKHINDLSPSTVIYSCGPERLMLALEEAVSSDELERVHVERFHPREITLTEPEHSFVVYCAKSDVEISVPEDESILVAADFEGIDVPGDCLEGTCGACETRVLEGEVDHRDSVLSAQARKEGDTMMICISRAKGNRLVIDL